MPRTREKRAPNSRVAPCSSSVPTPSVSLFPGTQIARTSPVRRRAGLAYPTRPPICCVRDSAPPCSGPAGRTRLYWAAGESDVLDAPAFGELVHAALRWTQENTGKVLISREHHPQRGTFPHDRLQQMLVQHHMAAEAGGDGHATQRWGRQMGSSSVTSRLICMGAEKVRQSNVACFSYKVFPFSKIVHITATLSATRQAQIPQIFG